MIVLAVPLGSTLLMSMSLTTLFYLSLYVAVCIAVLAGLSSRLNHYHTKVVKGDVKQLMASLEKAKVFQKVKQNELYWSEEKFNQLMKYAPIGMALINKQGKILQSNEALLQLSGYSEQELLGKDYHHFTTRHFPSTTLHFEKLLSNKRRNNEVLENKFVTKSEAIIWIQLNISAIRNKQDEIEFLIVQFVNIDVEKKYRLGIQQLNTELESKVQERTLELESKNKDLENFNYAVSHDLKAPLKNIKGLTDLLKEDVTGEARVCVNHIATMAIRMENLINNLFLFSKAQQLNLYKESFDLTPMLRTCFNELSNNYPQQGTALNLLSLPLAFGDKAAIRQVCENLLSNALKYASKKQKISITITGQQKDQFLVFSIKDNGVGFDRTQKEKLFKRFERLHKSSEYEGTGLGLAICQQIIQKHGGEIWAENNQEGGAIFYFTLPLQKQTQQTLKDKLMGSKGVTKELDNPELHPQ